MCWMFKESPHGCTTVQVFPADPYNAEFDRIEDQGRGGWKGSQAKPALLPKDVDKSNTTFRCAMLDQQLLVITTGRPCLFPNLTTKHVTWKLSH